MQNLYYISDNKVQEIEYTRDRMTSITPLFYSKKIDAQIKLKDLINDRINKDIANLIKIEKEIAGVL